MRHRQEGFTLAEIAIVAVLVGLVVGGIVAGRSIVAQARIKLVVNQLNGLHAAHSQYADRYIALPGDDPRAAARWTSGAKDGTGDGLLGGLYGDDAPTGDPMTELTVNASQGETLNYWWHLRLAGLVPSPPLGLSLASQPRNPFDGVIGVQANAIGFPVPAVCQANLPGPVAIGVDSQIDELSPTRGGVRGRKQTAPNQKLADTVEVASYNEGEEYVLCRRLD